MSPRFVLVRIGEGPNSLSHVPSLRARRVRAPLGLKALEPGHAFSIFSMVGACVFAAQVRARYLPNPACSAKRF